MIEELTASGLAMSGGLVGSLVPRRGCSSALSSSAAPETEKVASGREVALLQLESLAAPNWL